MSGNLHSGISTEKKQVASAAGRVNGSAVRRSASALRVTPPARYGSRSNRAVREPYGPSGRPGTVSFFGVGNIEKLTDSIKIPVLFKLVPQRTAIFLGSGHQMPTCYKPASNRLKNMPSENPENPSKHKPQDIGHGHQDTSLGRGNRSKSVRSRSRSKNSSRPLLTLFMETWSFWMMSSR